MLSKDKPYVLFVAEVIYFEISKIKILIVAVEVNGSADRASGAAVAVEGAGAAGDGAGSLVAVAEPGIWAN